MLKEMWFRNKTQKSVFFIQVHLEAMKCPTLMVCFHSSTPMLIHIPIICRKARLGLIPMVILMQSYYENYFKNHLVSTNISVKLGTVPICIGIGIRIASVETVLHIIILAIWIGIGIGISIGIGVGQWKHTISHISIALVECATHLITKTSCSHW